MNKRLDVLELFKGVVVIGLLGGLAAYVFVRLVVHRPEADAMQAVAVVWVLTLAGASLNGLIGVLPFVNALSNVFGSTVGSALGAFLGEYRRQRGVPDEQIIGDIQQGMAAVVNPTVEQELFRTGEDDVISRYKLNSGLTNIVIRYHEGLPTSRKRMTDDKVIDQRYWNLAYGVLKLIGMTGGETNAFRTKGSVQLDLAFVSRRWRVSLGQEVWVLPEGSEQWQQVDLYACSFLRRRERSVGNDESPVA